MPSEADPLRRRFEARVAAELGAGNADWQQQEVAAHTSWRISLVSDVFSPKTGARVAPSARAHLVQMLRLARAKKVPAGPKANEASMAKDVRVYTGSAPPA